VQEGENICFEVLEAVSGSIRRQDKTTVFRAKFSSITDKDIVAAMNSLGQPDENQSKSVDARQELDLRIGCAFTRFQTRFFQVYHLLRYRDSVTDPDPGCGAFLTPWIRDPRSGMGKNQDPDPG
jgi:DNA topoisomerase IA